LATSTQKLSVCLNIGDTSSIEEINSCAHFLKEVELSKTADNHSKLNLGKAYLNLAQVQISYNNDSLAEINLYHAVTYFEAVNNGNLTATSLTNLADVSGRLFKTKLQLKHLYKALVINEGLANPNVLISNYLNIADYYFYEDNLFLAKLFLQKAYGLNNTEIEPINLYKTKLLDASININEKKYANASKILDEISVKAFRLNDDNLIAEINLVKGDLYEKQNEIEQAIKAYNQAFKKFVKTKNKNKKTKTIVKLTKLFIDNRQFENAGKGIEQLSKLYKHNIKYEYQFYDLASKYYEAQGNNELALTYFKKSASTNQIIRDKIAKAQLKQMSALNQQIDSENKQQTNKIIEQQQASANKYQRFLMLALIVLAFTLSILAWMWYRQARLSKINAKRFEKSVEKRTAQLKIANLKLKKSNKRLEQFAYVASHDLKSPLRTVLGFLSLAKKNMPAEAYQAIGENIDIAIGSCKKMSHIIEDVLEYSRLQQDVSNKRFVDLNQTIEIVKGHLHELIDTKKGTLQVDALPGIYANSNQILQVFQNLIENAFKYNESQLPYVKVEYWEGEDYHNFAVEDNGIGFDSDLADKAFTMFQRLNNSRNYEGTGIGLAIVKEVIELHGGFITVASEEGYGTRFEFCLRKSKISDFGEPYAKKKLMSRRLVG